MVNFKSINKNTWLNFVGGFLFGYGFVAFFCFFYIDTHWAHLAPVNADPAHGFIFPHNEHGSITYFSAFQATSCYLLFLTSIPISFLGGFITPKKNIKYMKGRLSARMTFDPDDQSGVHWWGFGLGGLASPALVFWIGPAIVEWINSIGFTPNL